MSAPRARYKIRLRERATLHAVEVDYRHDGRWLWARTVETRVVEPEGDDADARFDYSLGERCIPSSNVLEVIDCDPREQVPA